MARVLRPFGIQCIVVVKFSFDLSYFQMCRTHLGDIFVILVAPVVFYAVPNLASCSSGTCLAGGFFFSAERNMLNNNALLGHVIENVTVSRPSKCFKRCANDCRCISFNYLTTSADESKCQLNEESRHTKREALQPQVDSQYYDLVIDYNIKASIIIKCLTNKKQCFIRFKVTRHQPSDFKLDRTAAWVY